VPLPPFPSTQYNRAIISAPERAMQPHGDNGAIAVTIFMIALYGGMILLGIAATVLWIVELVDVVRRQFKDPNEKLVWVLVIALTHWIGALIYMSVGKKQGWLPDQNWPPWVAPPPPP